MARLERVQFGHKALNRGQPYERQIAVIAQFLKPLDDSPEIVRLAIGCAN